MLGEAKARGRELVVGSLPWFCVTQDSPPWGPVQAAGFSADVWRTLACHAQRRWQSGRGAVVRGSSPEAWADGVFLNHARQPWLEVSCLQGDPLWAHPVRVPLPWGTVFVFLGSQRCSAKHCSCFMRQHGARAALEANLLHL